MRVDPNEIIFITENMPKGLIRTVADNVGVTYERVRVELYSLKKDYNEKIITECRRLLKAMSGKEYQQPQEA